MSSRSESLRLFFALVPGPAVRRQVVAIQQGLALQGRAVAQANLHITLAFLGQVARERLGELLETAGSFRLTQCRLALDHISGFGRAGVAFLAPEHVPERLETFQRALSAGLEAAAFPVDDKPWIPHVTLYRNLRKPCARMPVKPVSWVLRDYCLMASELQKTGPVYRVLQRWKSVRQGD